MDLLVNAIINLELVKVQFQDIVQALLKQQPDVVIILDTRVRKSLTTIKSNRYREKRYNGCE